MPVAQLPALVNRIEISQSKSKIANATVALFLVSWITFYLILRSAGIAPSGYGSLIVGLAISVYFATIKLKAPYQLLIDTQGITSQLFGHVPMRDIGGICISKDLRSANDYNLTLLIPKYEKYLDRFSSPLSFLRRKIFTNRKTISIPFSRGEHSVLQIFETLTRFRKQVDARFISGLHGDYEQQLHLTKILSEYTAKTGKADADRETFERTMDLLKRVTGGWSTMDTLEESEKRLEMERLRILEMEFMLKAHHAAATELLTLDQQNATDLIAGKIEQIDKDAKADFNASHDGMLLRRLEKEIYTVAQARLKQTNVVLLVSIIAIMVFLILKFV